MSQTDDTRHFDVHLVDCPEKYRKKDIDWDDSVVVMLLDRVPIPQQDLWTIAVFYFSAIIDTRKIHEDGLLNFFFDHERLGNHLYFSIEKRNA